MKEIVEEKEFAEKLKNAEFWTCSIVKSGTIWVFNIIKIRRFLTFCVKIEARAGMFWIRGLDTSDELCVIAANNNCIPAHTGGNGSLIILHGARGGSKPDPRLTDAIVGRSHDLRQPGSVGDVQSSSNDVLSTLTELKPLQTYSQQPAYQPLYQGPYDGGTLRHFIAASH